MAHIGADDMGGIKAVRGKARSINHLRHAQMMLVVAGLTAFGIVAVAAAVMIRLV
ncbi:hypothetical protein [uncultured Devosia sp.]|uniref:hypothetical protein n=1 Tax=uncultured Devosia sp. TaxID=211434 RepID=UPI0035CC2175